MRLNKYLAECGVASRRAADALIGAGKVAVGGRRAKLGASIEPARDIVTVNGQRVGNGPKGPLLHEGMAIWRSPRGKGPLLHERMAIWRSPRGKGPLLHERMAIWRSPRDKGPLLHEGMAIWRSPHLTLVLNKPLHVITSMRDEHGRKAVADLLPRNRRLFPVGRLDAQTTGVLLCTSDGALARFLTHPSSSVPRRYEVVARGNPNAETIAALAARNLKKLPDGALRFTVVLTEGKNRQVRRICARNGLRVMSLTRTQFGPVRLGNLKAGATRPLTEHEMRELARLRANRLGS